MLEDGRNAAQVLSIDGAEIKVLVAEAQEELAPSDRGRAIAQDRAETFIGRRRKRFQGGVIDESDTGRRRGDGQL